MAKRPEEENELNDRQERFCLEYIKDFNGTQAAIRAGYTDEPDSARVQASRMLSNPNISSRIKKLLDAQNKKVELTAETILRELLHIATADIGQAFHENGAMLKLHDMPEAIRKTISGVEVFEEFEGVGADRTFLGETKKIRFWDKVKALELLGKHLKLFTEKIEIEDKTGLAERLARARKRKKE